VVQQTGDVQATRLADQSNIQLNRTAFEAEEEIQRPLDISSAPELIQRRVVCDENGNCQSVPDEEEYGPMEGSITIPPSSDIPSSEPITEPLPTLRSPGAQPPGGPDTPNPNVQIEDLPKNTGQEYKPPPPRSWPNAPDTLRSPGNEGGGGEKPIPPVSFGFSPLLTGIAAGLATFFWSKKLAPAWMDEINPKTRKPYRNQEEYDEVHRR
jgi:hypothetical protein